MSWRPVWSVVCAVCGGRVLHRATVWSQAHHGRVCATHGGPAPTEQTYDPASLVHEFTDHPEHP